MVRLEDGAGGHGGIIDGKGFGGVINGFYLVGARWSLEEEIGGNGCGCGCGCGWVGGGGKGGGGAIKHVPEER